MSIRKLPIPRPGGPVHSWARRTERRAEPLANINGDGKYIGIEFGIFGITIRLLRDPFPHEKRGFGHRLAGKVMTIYPGAVQIGNQAAVYSAETNVTISADNTYIYFQYQKAAPHGVTIQSDTTEPANTDDYIRVWLYLMGYSATSQKAWISKLGWEGNYAESASYGDIGT